MVIRLKKKRAKFSFQTMKFRKAFSTYHIILRIALLPSFKLFTLQFDEFTDLSNYAQLMAFISFVDEDAIINQFLCCKKLPLTTNGQDVFDILITPQKAGVIMEFRCGNMY